MIEVDTIEDVLQSGRKEVVVNKKFFIDICKRIKKLEDQQTMKTCAEIIKEFAKVKCPKLQADITNLK